MKRILAFIGLGVISVLSLAFATWIVLSKFRPEDELRRMLEAMSQIETVREKAGFSWTRDTGSRVTTTLYTSGQIGPNAQHGTRFRVVRVGRGADYADLSGEVRSLEGSTYLTYNPPGPEVEGLDFEEKNVWVSFESGELPAWGSIIPGLDAPVFDESSASGVARPSEWTPESLERLRALIRRADVFYVTFDGLTELIYGKQTRIVDAWFDPDAIRAFLRDLIRAREGREPTDAERVVVERQAAALEKLTVRMWIGMQDHLLYRVQAAGGVPVEGSNTLIPVDVLIEFSDFNEPFEVVPPDEAIAFDEILRRTLAGLPDAGEAGGLVREPLVKDDSARLPVQTIETSDDPDEDGLDNVLEGFYGTDPANPDTDGDGVSDGEEVRNGKNPRGDGSLFGFGLDD